MSISANYIAVDFHSGDRLLGPFTSLETLRNTRIGLRSGNFGKRIVVRRVDDTTDLYVYDWVRKGWVSFVAPLEPVL